MELQKSRRLGRLYERSTESAHLKFGIDAQETEIGHVASGVGHLDATHQPRRIVTDDNAL